MAIFVDTSGLYAVLDVRDKNHSKAAAFWRTLAQQDETLVTSNYVLLETIAIVARRLGLEAVRDFQTRFATVVEVHWVDEHLHELGLAALLTSGRRYLSLVDCISFEVMRQLAVESAFAFDAHFADQGFRCLP